MFIRTYIWNDQIVLANSSIDLVELVHEEGCKATDTDNYSYDENFSIEDICHCDSLNNLRI